MILLTERQAMEKVLEYVVQRNSAKMNDPAFVEELKKWIRFSGDEAVRTGDGLSSRESHRRLMCKPNRVGDGF